MRPVKDIFVEEYWDIAFRKFSENDTIVSATKSKYVFDELKSTKRFWYADPFLFEKEGMLFLFVEMFDNVTEKGLIGYSEFINGKFTRPQAALEEKFHLSYPYVFEKDGVVYMMPETRDDGCIQLYRAERFPNKWVKDRIILQIKDAVDTVIFKDNILTSVITAPAEKKTQLEIYNMSNNNAPMKNPVKSADQISRGAGRIIEHKGKVIRPAQNCTNAEYGAGLIFYEVDLDKKSYTEKIFSQLSPSQIECGNEKIYGIHTYARTGNIEVVDVKRKRFNWERILWIIKRKI